MATGQLPKSTYSSIGTDRRVMEWLSDDSVHPEEAPTKGQKVWNRYACLVEGCEQTYGKWKDALRHTRQHASESASADSSESKDLNKEISNFHITPENQALSQGKSVYLADNKKIMEIDINKYSGCVVSGCNLVLNNRRITAMVNHCENEHGMKDMWKYKDSDFVNAAKEILTGKEWIGIKES